MSERQMGQICNCAEQMLQKPVCWHGISLIIASASKHNVQLSSVTLSFLNSSRNRWRGRTICRKFISNVTYKVVAKTEKQKCFLPYPGALILRNRWRRWTDALAEIWIRWLRSWSDTAGSSWRTQRGKIHFWRKRTLLANLSRKMDLRNISENFFKVNARLDSVQTKNDFLGVKIDEAAASAACFPGWQGDGHRLCIVPYELTTTIERHTVSVITNPVTVVRQKVRFLLRPEKAESRISNSWLQEVCSPSDLHDSHGDDRALKVPSSRFNIERRSNWLERVTITSCF